MRNFRKYEAVHSEKCINESMIDSFRAELYSNEKSEDTISKYVRAVRIMRGVLVNARLTREWLIEYRAELLKSHRVQTVNGIFTALNTFFDFIGRNELRLKLIRVQNRAFADENRELSENEYRRLLNEAEANGNERLYMILMTLCSTGIRVGELRFITVEAAGKRNAEIYLKGKTRSVLIPKKLCSRLLAYAKTHGVRSGSIFVTRSGKAIDRSNLWHEMKRLCKNAGVDERKVFPHNLRHLFARMFYAVEKNIAHLADVLGHSRIETTRIYLTVSTLTHERILNRMRLIV